MQYNRVPGRLRDFQAPVICTRFLPSRQHGVRLCQSNVDGILEVLFKFSAVIYQSRTIRIVNISRTKENTAHIHASLLTAECRNAHWNLFPNLKAILVLRRKIKCSCETEQCNCTAQLWELGQFYAFHPFVYPGPLSDTTLFKNCYM